MDGHDLHSLGNQAADSSTSSRGDDGRVGNVLRAWMEILGVPARVSVPSARESRRDAVLERLDRITLARRGIENVRGDPRWNLVHHQPLSVVLHLDESVAADLASLWRLQERHRDRTAIQEVATLYFEQSSILYVALLIPHQHACVGRRLDPLVAHLRAMQATIGRAYWAWLGGNRPPERVWVTLASLYALAEDRGLTLRPVRSYHGFRMTTIAAVYGQFLVLASAEPENLSAREFLEAKSLFEHCLSGFKFDERPTICDKIAVDLTGGRPVRMAKASERDWKKDEMSDRAPTTRYLSYGWD